MSMSMSKDQWINAWFGCASMCGEPEQCTIPRGGPLFPFLNVRIYKARHDTVMICCELEIAHNTERPNAAPHPNRANAYQTEPNTKEES